MKKSEAHFAGLSLTFLLHAGIVVLLLSRGDDAGCSGGSDADAAKRFEDSQTIEASLAFKAVEPKDRQPQKQKKKKYAPDDNAPVIADADAGPRQDAPDHKIKVRPDEVDIASILEKNRQQNPDLSSTGADEIPKEGSAGGSEWGTEKDAKGHPYAGELKGRIHSAWELPAIEQGGGEAHGCVKLDKDGKIVDRFVKHKSGNANLDRSVELALRQAPDMTEPVPDDLIDLMTVKGICFRFKP